MYVSKLSCYNNCFRIFSNHFSWFISEVPVERVTEIPVEHGNNEELETRSDDDNKSDSSSDDEGTESHLSSLGPWGDDPEIQEKVR